MDERFKIHRLRSTSLAGIVGGIVCGFWTLYQFYAKGDFRWDLFSVLLVMGVVKISVMIYYRITN